MGLGLVFIAIRSCTPGEADFDFRGGNLQIPSAPQPPKVAGWWIISVSSFLMDPSTSVSASNSSEHELIQYRFPVGLGPSSKIWPKWDPQFLQLTSVRINSGFLMINKRLPPIPEASALKVTLALSMTSKNEGHPEPESYFVLDRNRLSLHTLQL